MTDYNDVLDKMINRMRSDIARRANYIHEMECGPHWTMLLSEMRENQAQRKREIAAIIRLRRYNNTLEREFKQYYSTGFGGKLAKWTIDEVVNVEAREAIE